MRARIDTCTEANIIALSVSKLIFKDSDCKQLAPSTKVAIRTYTTDKINIVGSCSLFAVHPDTSKLKQVTFYVTSHEGSVVLSCKTSLKLYLIHPHSNLDQVPDCASLIYINPDHPIKRKSKKNMQEKYVNQCVKEKVPIQDEISKWECQANVYKEDGKNCQENVHMQLAKPESLQSASKQMNPRRQQYVCDDNNCQSTKHNKKSMCSDKNCHDNRSVIMQPVKATNGYAFKGTCNAI